MDDALVGILEILQRSSGWHATVDALDAWDSPNRFVGNPRICTAVGNGLHEAVKRESTLGIPSVGEAVFGIP